MPFEATIFLLALVVAIIILYVDDLQTKNLKEVRTREPVTADWKTEYREASDDRRQYTNLTWQLPSAILVADGLAIGFAYSKDFLQSAPLWAPSMLLFAASLFNVIMYVNFWKFAYRSYSRFLRLQRIESVKKMRRLGGKEPGPVRYGTWRWMGCVVILLTALLLELSISLILH
jgi:hypothetical protein